MNFLEIIIGFVVGFLSGFIANVAYRKYEQSTRGIEPFIQKRTEKGLIKFEGQIPNTNTGQAAMNKVEQKLTEGMSHSPQQNV